MTIFWLITKLGKSVCRVIQEGLLTLSRTSYKGLSQWGSFCNLLVQIGSAFIGFMETWILASTTVQYTSHLESSVLRSRISYPSRPNLSTYSTL